MPFDGTEYESKIYIPGKIDQVFDILSTPDCWCKGALYGLNRRRCIVGAMQAIGGVIDLRDPILQAIREITGRRYANIEAFNDARATTYPLVWQVPFRTRENLAFPLGLSPAAPTARKRAGLWARVK